MKFIKTFIILILFFSCSNKEQISEFENILGDENSKILTYLVNDFENDFLKKQYSNLDTPKAYRQFLTEMKNDGQTADLSKISEESKLLFEQSNLRLEIYSIPDSIWIERESNNSAVTKIRYKYLTSNGDFHFSTSESHFNYKGNSNKDSIINIRKNWVRMNYEGRYKKAFEKVFQKTGFVKEYIDVMDSSGGSNPASFVYRILETNIDYNDYFIKRLILTEMVYTR